MSKMSERPPVWFVLLLVLITLPIVAIPSVLGAMPGEAFSEIRTLLKIYPAYVLVADWFAWICWWPRRLMAWIMVGLIVLSHLAVALMYVETVKL